MAGRLIDLAVRARRLITPVTHAPRTAGDVRLTARRQVGGRLTEFSFRLAFVIDLAYVGMGAIGGAAIARAGGAPTPAVHSEVTPPAPAACVR